MTKLPPQNISVKQEPHGRKYRGQPSYAIPVWNGLLEHRDKIGPSVWEFLWLLDKITVEDERGIGWCLGKTPIDTKRIADDLNEHENTAYANLDRLTTEGYIIRKRTPRGYAIGVVNSRKFNAFRSKADSQKTVNHHQRDSQKTVTRESQKTVIHSASDSQETGKVIHSFQGSDSQKTVSRRDSTETLQEDKAVQRDKTRGDSTAVRPQLSPEIEKLVVRLEIAIGSELSGRGWYRKNQTEPEYGPVRKWFETEARDQGIDFRLIGDLYVEAMAKVRKQLEPTELIQNLEPYIDTTLDQWPIDPDCTERYRDDNGTLVMVFAHGIQECRQNACGPDWFAFDDEAPQERTVDVLAQNLEQSGTRGTIEC